LNNVTFKTQENKQNSPELSIDFAATTCQSSPSSAIMAMSEPTYEILKMMIGF